MKNREDNQFLWFLCVVASIFLFNSSCNARDVIYIRDWSRERANNLMGSKEIVETRNSLDQYAKASELNNLRDGDKDELRFWITSVNFDVNTIGYDTVGYIFSKSSVRICRIKYPRRTRIPFKGSCKTDEPTNESASVLSRIKELEKYEYRSLGCEVMDGAWMQIDGVSEGRRFVLRANNPDSCTDEGSKIVADVLSAIDKAVR